MRKRIKYQDQDRDQDQENFSAAHKERLDLESLAQVEISSEDAAHPIEDALTLSGQAGWLRKPAGRRFASFLMIHSG